MPISRKKRNSISKDMSNLRKRCKKLDVNKTVIEIKKYYYRNEYDEKLLFNRIDKLETEKEIANIFFASTVGVIIGLIFAFYEDIKEIVSFHRAESTLIFIIKIIIVTLIGLAILITISWLILLFKKLYRFVWKNDGRSNYLNEKEIEIIKEMIENKGKRKKRRKYKYSSRSLKRRT